jgi:ribose transport system substrate-binding protein
MAKGKANSKGRGLLAGLMAVACLVAFTVPAMAAEDWYRPDCFKMASDAELKVVLKAGNPKIIQYKEVKPPYKFAFVNGFTGNAWRIQAIQATKAWAARAENKPFVKELKVVSVGTDVAAQIAAIDNFIAAGYNGITTIGLNPTAFDAVIKRAKKAGCVFVPFDNVLDTDQVSQVNEPMFEMGRMKAREAVKGLKNGKGKVLEIRGLTGNSTDRDRHRGMKEIWEQYKGIEVVEVVGNWDTGTVQKVTADAIATHRRFDGIACQHGSAGAINAVIDAGHPIVPMGTDSENGVRLLMAKHKIPGVSVGQSPSLAAVAMEVAKLQLQGKPMPVLIHMALPHVFTPDGLKDGVNYFTKLPPTFETSTGFKECGLDFTAEELLAQTGDNM